MYQELTGVYGLYTHFANKIGKRSQIIPAPLSYVFYLFRMCQFLFLRLNDDRQGEGGTLAVINVNITTTLKIMQGLNIRKTLIFFRKIFVPRVGIGPTSKP